MGIHYDQRNRRAFETELRRNPETGAIERVITREIPYLGEPPFGPLSKERGTAMSRDHAERLRQDIYGFFLHADDSPLDATTREQLARYIARREAQGGNQ